MTDPQTLNELFFNAIERFTTKRAALCYKSNGEWREITHQELAQRVHHTAIGLIEAGVEPGDRVAILSNNRPEWAIADFACLTARCTDVAVYPTLPTPQVEYLLRDSGSKGVFVEDREQLDKVLAVRERLPDLSLIIVFEPQEGMAGPGVVSLQELMQRGRAAVPNHPNYRRDALAAQPDDLATLIYTSGTTGDPKGVMLTHHNFTSNVVGALKVLDIGPSDSCLSILPLSHSFERMAGHYTMFHAGVTINYAESIEMVQPNLAEVRPTVVLAVPRLYEKIFARVLENALAGGALKRRIFFWARRNAERWADLTLAGQPVPALLGINKQIGDRLVFSKLRARTGGRVRFFVSGGAALNPEISKFFFAAGLPIMEGYGLTETSPVIAVNPLENLHIGTVGPPIPGVEVAIAPDGEILCRGPNVMIGYYKKPEETRAVLEPDGWFHTGDVGELDRDGYVKITDRKKDLIVTAGGKNVAPQPIENMIRANRFVLNALMVGDKRKFPAVLIVPEFDTLKAWAAERNIPTDDTAQLIAQPDVAAMMEREVMGTLRDLASFEMPKKILLLEADFTIESGELSAKLSVKRKVVEQRYRDRIDALYAD